MDSIVEAAAQLHFAPSEVARRLWRLGYFPLPCDGKIPAGAAWQNRANPFEVDFWPGQNVGVLCGRNNVVGVDIDIEDKEIGDAVAGACWALLGAPTRYGRAPRRMLVCRTAGPAKSRDLKYEREGKTETVQLIGVGKQFVAFGVHPDTGKPYRWEGASVLDVPAAKLPLVDIEEVERAIDGVMAGFGRRRKFVVGRTRADGTLAALPADVTEHELATLREWGENEARATVGKLRAMAAGTGRGTLAHQLGLRIGLLIRVGLLDLDVIAESIFDATFDGNAAFHSFGRGADMSEGEAVAIKLDSLRLGAAALAEAERRGVSVQGFPDAEAPKELAGALSDRAATLGALRKSKQVTQDRANFSRLCVALARREAITELQAFALGALAADFKINAISDGKNPRAASAQDEKLADAILATAKSGGDLRTALELGEAVLKPPTTVGKVAVLEGGVTGATDDFFEAVSTRLACVNANGSIFYVHRSLEGRDERLSDKDVLKLFSNVFAGGADGARELAVSWWMKHPRHKVKKAVFKPEGAGKVADDEYNFWLGFGVERSPGLGKLRRFARHLLETVCRRDKAKFKYLIKWLAWAVQNPGGNPGVVVVLKGTEGSGKSVVSNAMRKLFGRHAALVSTPEQLLGTHNDRLEHASFVALEEALFAGDPRQASAMRARITDPSVTINPKFVKAYDAPNVMHAILTTNHEWAVHAGQDARRWFVCEVGERRVGDRGYWAALHEDLEGGGYEQLLNALLEVDLADWHPREVLRTKELAEQRRMSADNIEQWLRASVEAGGIEYTSPAGTRTLLAFGREWKTATLYGAYCESLRRLGGRPAGIDLFSKRLRALLGAGSFSFHVVEDGKRGRGYKMPAAWELELRLTV